MKKILILVPGKHARGGITNYYYSIKEDFPENVIYITRGSRSWPKRSNKLTEALRLIGDYWNFIKKVSKKEVGLVQTTTAFASKSIIRDGIFIILGKLFRKKTIVFFRGWDNEFVHNISGIKKMIVQKVFLKTDAIIDLAQDNIDHLKKMGYKNSLFLETTLVNKRLIEKIDIDAQINKRIGSNKKTILFLSRLEKTKGVYSLLEVFKKVKQNHPEFRLVYAGDGSESDNLKAEVAKQNIRDVEFTGFVEGDKKQLLFLESSIFVFLSDFEGMPNAVLEAMAFGLPVITTNVGGIASVFKDNINGRIFEKVNIDLIADSIIDITTNTEKYLAISKNNYSDAKNKFWSNIVAERMMKIFGEVSNK